MTLFVDTGTLSIAEKVSKMTSRHGSIAENVTFQVSGSTLLLTDPPLKLLEL